MDPVQLDPIAIGVCITVMAFMVGTIVMLLLDAPAPVRHRSVECPVQYTRPEKRVDVSHIHLPDAVASRLRVHVGLMGSTVRALAVASLLMSIQSRERSVWWHVERAAQLHDCTPSAVFMCDVSILVSFLLPHCDYETAPAVCNSVIDSLDQWGRGED